jgi:hypothetical protein
MTTTEDPTTEEVILPVRPDFEGIRLAVMTRTSAGLTDHSYAACKLQSGEMLRSASHTDTQAVLIFETKYGNRPGIRTVILTAPCREAHLTLVINTTADAPKTATPDVPKAPKAPWSSVMDFKPEVQPIPMSPADGTSTVMSYTFHVRSLGDHRVICSTTNLGDAKRIVKALGNVAVWQFRDFTSYDDTTTWRA